MCGSVVRACVIMGILAIAGCASNNTVDSQSISRPLGRNIPTYQAPDLKHVAPEIPTPVVIPQTPLTLRKSLALALLHNPELEAFSWQLRAQEAKLLQESLAPNPVLMTRIENFGGPRPMNEFESARMTFSISQLIELGDKRMKRTRLAEKNYALSAWNYETKRLDVITQVTQRFIEVLADQQRVKLTEQNLTLAQQLYEIVQDRAQVGVIPTVEIDKALIRVSDEQIQLYRAQQKLAATSQQLSAMWGNTAPGFIHVSGALESVQKIPSQEQLLYFISQNPDIARWTAEIAQRQAALELADSQAFPSVSVGAGIRRFNAPDDNVLVFEIGVPLQVFDQNQGARSQARYQLLKARVQQKNTEIKIHTLLINHYKKLTAVYHEVITLRDTILPAARSAYDAARKAFEQGITNYIDVLDADRTLVRTERQYIEALVSYHQTVAALEGLIGESLTDIN